MKKIFLTSSLALLFLTSCLLFAPKAESTPEPIPPTAPPPTQSPSDRSIYKDGLVPEYQGILNELPYASIYDIKFNISDDMYHITGSETVIYTNAEDVELKEVKFRLFPNILGGDMHVDEVFVNEEVIIPNYTLNDSLLTVPLKNPIQPGESVTLKMNFKITVPQSVELNYGVQAYYDNVLALAHAYPMIPAYDDEGWNAEIPPQSGDVTYADMSFFIITVEAPKDVVLVGSGREISHKDTGSRQTVRYEAGPVRDFYLAASSDYEVVSKEVNGITIRFYYLNNSQEGAESALDVAARSMEVYGKRYVPYPYSELDFVSTPTLALGIEYPGMIAITNWIVQPDNSYLEATIAHEVGHQWFYNLVGNDQLDDPWLDESLTQFATLQYFTDEYGQSGNDSYRLDMEDRWNSIGREEIPVGLPVRAYTDVEYSGIVYGRGGLFFEALREEMGSDNFDAFLKEYVKINSWGVATPEKLQVQAEKNCACDLTPLFEKWIFP
ncbi:MAG: M1 family metallopeptidase [Anaerolineales bacterium]|nr:M1 family metallopeptidase [Anaerolineales bacterium]